MYYERPRWVRETPDDVSRQLAEQRYLVLLASISTCPKGSMRSLAERTGLNHATLKSAVSRSRGYILSTEARSRIINVLIESLR